METFLFRSCFIHMLSNRGQKPVFFVKKIIGEVDCGFYFRGAFPFERTNVSSVLSLYSPQHKGHSVAFVFLSANDR